MADKNRWDGTLEISRSASLGVIAAYQFQAQANVEVHHDLLTEALSGAHCGQGHVWFHLNGKNDHARAWLTACSLIPEDARDFLLDANAAPGRVELIDGAVAACLSDLAYEFGGDPGDIQSFRFFLSKDSLITIREAPLTTTNRLRLTIRDGKQFATSLSILNELLGYQVNTLHKIVDEAEDRIERIEDRIFGGAQTVEEGALARVRWLCGRLQRRFAPEQKVLAVVRRSQSALISNDDAEALADRVQLFDEAFAEIADLQSRARLLQEEMNSRQASATSRNLYILSIITALLLPITLVTGVFGMNVAGLPGTKSEDAFLWVLAGMALLGVASVVLLRMKKLI